MHVSKMSRRGSGCRDVCESKVRIGASSLDSSLKTLGLITPGPTAFETLGPAEASGRPNPLPVYLACHFPFFGRGL